VVNKVDRPDARIAEVVNEVEELFLDLDADEHQIDFPILYANARAGWAATEPGVEGTDLKPLFEAIIERIPAPSYDPAMTLQALVCNLDASPYVGRLASVASTTARSEGIDVGWCSSTAPSRRPRSLSSTSPSPWTAIDADEAGPGEIAAVAGMAEITIGETLADPDQPVALPPSRSTSRA